MGRGGHRDGETVHPGKQIAGLARDPASVLLGYLPGPARRGVRDPDEPAARKPGINPGVVLAQVPHAHNADLNHWGNLNPKSQTVKTTPWQ